MEDNGHFITRILQKLKNLCSIFQFKGVELFLILDSTSHFVGKTLPDERFPILIFYFVTLGVQIVKDLFVLLLVPGVEGL